MRLQIRLNHRGELLNMQFFLIPDNGLQTVIEDDISLILLILQIILLYIVPANNKLVLFVQKRLILGANLH